MALLPPYVIKYVYILHAPQSSRIKSKATKNVGGNKCIMASLVASINSAKLTKAKAATIQITLLIIASRFNSCSVFIVLDSAEGNDRNYDIVLVTAR